MVTKQLRLYIYIKYLHVRLLDN
uniref:Uncharacterized protein n=1 Tax=Anguilla anguilla TaxID=7936 RepID=A0A0E9TN75_ANGAN